MERLLELEVITAERRVLHERAESIILPAANGYLGILPGHAPMIAGLTWGSSSSAPTATRSGGWPSAVASRRSPTTG